MPDAVFSQFRENLMFKPYSLTRIMDDSIGVTYDASAPQYDHNLIKSGKKRFELTHMTDFDNSPAQSGLDSLPEDWKYQGFFKNSKIVKLLVDPTSWQIMDANQAAVEFFSLSLEGLKKRKFNDVIDLPPNKVQGNYIQTKIRKSIALSLQYRLESGKLRELELFIDPLFHKGTPIFYGIIIYDISERKRISGFLQRARERIQQIFQDAHVGIYQITPAGRFLFANPTTARMFGYDSPEELVQTVTDVADHYADPAERKHIVKMLAHAKGSVLFELCLKRKNGEIFWVSCDSKIVRDNVGHLLHFEGFMTDITSRKLAESSLKFTEKKLLDIFNNGLLAIYQITAAGKFIFANPAAAKMFGYDSPEHLIREVENVADLYVDTEHRKIILNKLEQLKKDDFIEARFRRRDGSVFWAALDSRIVRDAEGNILYYEGFMSDITERKIAAEALSRSEKRIRDIFRNSPVGIYQITPKGELLFANPAAAVMFGYPSPEAFINDINIIEDVYVNPTSRQILLNRLDQYGVIDHAEVEFKRKDSTTFWASYRSRIVRDETGRFTHHEVFISDITKRRQAEEALHFAIEKKELYRQNLETTFGSIPSEIISVDKDMRVIAKNNAFNNSFCMFSAIQPGESLKPFLKSNTCSCIEHLIKTLKTRKPIRKHQIECVHSGMPTQIKEINCSPLMDEQNQHVGGAILVMTNITRLATLEKKLNARNSFRNIIGKSKRMRDIYNLLEQLTDLDTTVLVIGESGTGKELIADALHYGGEKRSKPFVKINCAALPDNLLESELFGHARGAFTGAIKDKIGRFQAAEGGTIFLDEIGDISPLLQLKLLRVLENKEFERLGEVKPRKANVRIIAATNADLKEKVSRGQFRKDLFYRLKVMPIKLPPLRDRSEDIPLLVSHFLAIFNDNLKKNIVNVSNEVMRHFMAYSWPGNVRELKHTLEHACILCAGGKIDLKHLPLDQMEHTPAAPIVPSKKPGIGPHDILDALKIAEGNKAKAARILGIGRVTLYRKLKEFDLDSAS